MSSPKSSDFKKSIAASIGSILIEIEVVEVEVENSWCGRQVGPGVNR